MTTLPTPTASKMTILQQTLEDLTRQAEAAIARVEATADATIQRMARGTLNPDSQVAPAPVEAKEPAARTRSKRDTVQVPSAPKAYNLRAEVEAALRTRPMTVTELSAHLGEKANGKDISEMIVVLNGEKRLWNTGSSEVPRWVWILGDQAPAGELRTMVHALLQERPITFGELLTATGARETRVYGILANLRRQGKPLVHLGEKTRGKWFLVPQLGGE